MYKSTDLMEYLPDWFRNIVEMLEICKTESTYFDILAEFINKVSENFYFQTLDESAIALWERVLYIVPNPQTESIEFRRERVLNRISTKPPYTLSFLYDGLSSQLRQLIRKNFVGRFPTQTFSRSGIYKKQSSL